MTNNSKHLIITISFIAILNLILLNNVVSTASVEYLVIQLFQELCEVDINQTISLYECEERLIQHDKEKGNYRGDQIYKKETLYLMSVYDIDKDGRLSRKQTLAMGYDIHNGEVNSREIQLYWRQYGHKIQDQRHSRRQELQKPQQQNQQQLL